MMKRRIFFGILTAALCMVMLFGCAKGRSHAATPVMGGFTCEVSIDYRGMALKGQLSRMQDGRLLVTLSEPPSLSGMAISWDGEEMAMEMGRVRVPVNAANVPQSALVKSLLTVLTASPNAGELTDEGFVVRGEVDGKAYTIVCAPDTGLIRSLSVPDDELTVTFFETALLTNNT
jgi:hypothetical protein